MGQHMTPERILLPSHSSPSDLSVAQLQAAFREHQITPSDALESVAARIHRDTGFNGYHAITLDEAQHAAEESDRRWKQGCPLGPLDGVPVTVKENLGRRGVTMPSGTALPDPPSPERDAPIVERLHEAGAVIVGSTVMPDWGMLSSGVSSRHGISRSPWNPQLTTGGSSSGAAVTAAAGHGPVHIGTDIGGSIRLPGTWNGLATLKPSAGLLPLDHPYTGRAAGPMARRAVDLFPLMSVAARWDDRDHSSHPYPPLDFTTRASSPEGMVVGLQMDGGPGLELDDEVRAAVSAAAEIFASYGARVVEVPAITTESLLRRIDDFWRARSLNSLLNLPREPQQGEVLDYILAWCRKAQSRSAAQAVGDYEALGELAARARALTRHVDVLLSPVTPQLAFAAENPMPHPHPEEPMAHISYTLPFNMSGQPAGTVNVGKSADGRWIGMQIAGPMASDADVLRLMAWWEQVRPASAAPDWASLDAALLSGSMQL